MMKAPILRTIRRANSLTQPLPKPMPRGAKTRDLLPDLQALVIAFADAQALVVAAHKVMLAGSDYGPEVNVLRQGVDALNRFSDALERADLQLARFRRNGSVPRA